MPIIRVEMLEGRSVEQKRELVEVLTRESSRILECAPTAVTIVLHDIERHNWGSAGRLKSDPTPS